MLVELGAGVSNSAIVSVLWTLSCSLFATSFSCHATRDPIVEEIKKCKHKVKKCIQQLLTGYELKVGNGFTQFVTEVHMSNF